MASAMMRMTTGTSSSTADPASVHCISPSGERVLQHATRSNARKSVEMTCSARASAPAQASQASATCWAAKRESPRRGMSGGRPFRRLEACRQRPSATLAEVKGSEGAGQPESWGEKRSDRRRDAGAVGRLPQMLIA
eukprot:scaffold8558_cov23-Tisochrysis_lutea.AAC.2